MIKCVENWRTSVSLEKEVFIGPLGSEASRPATDHEWTLNVHGIRWTVKLSSDWSLVLKKEGKMNKMSAVKSAENRTHI